MTIIYEFSFTAFDGISSRGLHEKYYVSLTHNKLNNKWMKSRCIYTSFDLLMSSKEHFSKCSNIHQYFQADLIEFGVGLMKMCCWSYQICRLTILIVMTDIKYLKSLVIFMFHRNISNKSVKLEKRHI